MLHARPRAPRLPRFLAFRKSLLVLPLLVALCAFLPVAPACAQVPLVPDPIATPDLQPIIDTLALSDQQALSLLPIHDAYKERYRAFLDGDVKELQDQLVDIGLQFTKGKFEIPPRRDLEAIVAHFKRLLDKSRSLDRSFFVEVGGILAEDQMPRLERARINRELKVFRDILGGIGEMNRGSGVNLAEMTRGLDLSPQEREQVDPVLNDYESQLLAKSNSIYSVLTDAAKVVLDFIDESGIRGMSMEQMMMMAQNPPVGLMNKAQSTFEVASKPIQQEAFEVSQMNMRMYHRLTPLLSVENARDLRDRYYRRAYREIYSGESKWEARYRLALKLEGLSEEQTTALTEQRDSYLSLYDAAIEGGVALLEASRQYKTFRQFSRQEPDPATGKIDEAVVRIEGIASSAVKTLNSMLGETMVAKLDETLKKKPELADERRTRIVARANAGAGTGGGGAGGGNNGRAGPTPAPPPPPQQGVEVGGVQVEVNVDNQPFDFLGANDPESNRYLPQPMAAKAYEQTLTAVGLGGDDHAVAMTLFDSYRADYDKLRGEPLKIQKEGEEATPIETGKGRAARHEELLALDQRLFSDLSLLVQDASAKTALQTLQQTRMRSIAAEVSKSMVQSFGEDEAYIDLVELITTSDLQAKEQQQAAAALKDYNSRVATYTAQRLENAREVRRRAESMARAGQRGGGRGGPGQGGQGGWNGNPGAGGNQAMQFAAEKWTEARKTLGETNDKIIAVNRESLDQIAAVLSADALWQLRLAYNQAAYPEIFRDDRSAEKTLQGALAITDLDESQRERITEVATQYRTDFYAVCEQMVGLRKQRDFDVFAGQMPKKDDIDREVEIEKLRWNRNEVSARARLKLSLILTDDQAKALPELQSR